MMMVQIIKMQKKPNNGKAYFEEYMEPQKVRQDKGNCHVGGGACGGGASSSDASGPADADEADEGGGGACERREMLALCQSAAFNEFDSIVPRLVQIKLRMMKSISIAYDDFKARYYSKLSIDT